MFSTRSTRENNVCSLSWVVSWVLSSEDPNSFIAFSPFKPEVDISAMTSSSILIESKKQLISFLLPQILRSQESEILLFPRLADSSSWWELAVSWMNSLLCFGSKHSLSEPLLSFLFLSICSEARCWFSLWMTSGSAFPGCSWFFGALQPSWIGLPWPIV